MGRPIDEKIIVMRLDNSDFAAKAAQTSGLLGKLQGALNKIPGVNLGKTEAELKGIQNAANNTKMDALGSAVQGVGNKFTAMQVIATTALATITNAAVNAGAGLAKSLTLDPVISGFQEYETKIGAIGTVLSNTEWAGTTLSDVNKALAELNTYADNTVYSFGDMTENIGRFTAAGVKLDDSTIAIKGLSNLAAASGSNVEQLNSAMYQMSQGMAAGKLGLEDWNSLVNAGMGGKKTQDALLKTAKAMGKNVDMSDGFRMSLQKGWLTSDVFLQTMKQFGKDKSMTEAATAVRTFTGFWDSLMESVGSGWATSFENIFGNFEESTKLWTGLSNAVGGWFGKTSDARNKLLKGVADKGGMDNIFKGVQNAVKPLGQIFSAIGDGFHQIFPPASVDSVMRLTEGFKNFTAGLKLSEQSVSNLKTIFAGVFSVFDTVWTVVKKLGSAFMNLIPAGAGGGVLGFLASIARLAIGFNESVKSGNFLTDAIDGLGVVFGAIGSAVGSAIGNIVAFAGSITTHIGTAISWLKDKLAPVGEWFKEAFKGFDGNDLLGAGTLVAVGIGLKKLFGLFDKGGGIFDSFTDAISNIGDGLGDVFSNLGDAISGFTSAVQYSNLLKIAIAIGILAVSLKLLEGMKVADITKGIVALAASMGIMMAALMVITKFNLVGGMRASATLIAVAASISVMASALKKISDLNPKELATGIGGLVGIVSALSIAIIAISKWGGKVAAGSIQLMALATAIYILSGAVDKMSSIEVGGLAKSLASLGLIFAALAGFLKLASGSKFGVGSAVGVLAIAGAIKIMVSAIQQIASIDVAGLVKGLVSIGVILAEIAIFSRLASGGNLAVAGVGLVLIAGAINAMMGPIQQFASMSWVELAKGLGSMAVALAAVAAAALLMNGGLVGAAGIAVMAGALMLMVPPIVALGNMSWMGLLKGFVGLAGGIALLAGASILLTPVVPSMIAFGLALVVVGAGIALAGVGFAAFGAGLGALATITAASIAGIVSAFGLLITGIGSLIPGIVNFVVTLGTTLVNGLVTLIPAVVNGALQLVNALMQAFSNNVSKFIKVGGDIIVKIMEGFGQQAPRITQTAMEVMVTVINSMSQAIASNGPALIQAFTGLIQQVLLVMVQAGVQIMTAMFGWIPGVSSAAAEMGAAAENSIRNNFNVSDVGSQGGSQFASGLAGASGAASAAGASIAGAAKSGVAGFNIVGIGQVGGQGFASGVAGTAGSAGAAGTSIANAGRSGAAGVSFTGAGTSGGSGFASGVSSTSGAASSAGSGIANAGKSAAAGISFNPVGMAAGSGFASGISGQTGSSSSAGSAIANAAKSGASGISLVSIGTNMAAGMARGIAAGAGSVMGAAKSLAEKASATIKGALDIHSPSRVTHKLGKHTGQGFANGISSKRKTVRKSASQLASEAKKRFNTSMEKAEYKFKMGKINDKQYIASLKSIKKRYSKYGDLVRKVNLKIKKVEENASKYRKELIEKQFAKEKKSIDNKLYYNKLSLYQEYNEWHKLQLKYKKGTAQRSEADKEVYRIKNEINDKLKSINKDYTDKIKAANKKLIADEKALNKEYKTAIKERQKDLVGWAGTFEEIEKKPKVSGQHLIDNLKGQIKEFSSWTSNIKNLASRGLNASLLAELQEMGPDANDKLKALRKLTDAQLTEYSALYVQKNSLARKQATKELEGMKKDTAKKISELKAKTKKQLQSYRTSWEKELKKIQTGTAGGMVHLTTSMNTIGKNSIKGLIKGMQGMSDPLKKEANKIANSVSKTIKKALKIHSPSRVMIGLGGYAGEGLAIGLSNSTSKVVGSAENLATSAQDAVKDFLTGFEIPESDNELHFKAVVDYSSVDSSLERNLNVVPNTALTKGLVSATKSSLGQNDNNSPSNIDKSSTTNNTYEINVEAKGLTSRSEVRKLADRIQAEIKNSNDRGRRSRGEEVAF